MEWSDLTKATGQWQNQEHKRDLFSPKWLPVTGQKHFIGKHTMNHTRLDFTESDSTIASSASKFGSRGSRTTHPLVLLFLFAHFLGRNRLPQKITPHWEAFSGRLVHVWFRSGDFARCKFRKLHASAADGHWELTYNGTTLPHEISITAVMLWEVPKPYRLWFLQPQHTGTKLRVLLLSLTIYSSMTYGFSFRKFIAIFTRISVSKKNKHHVLEQRQKTTTQILVHVHSSQLNCF